MKLTGGVASKSPRDSIVNGEIANHRCAIDLGPDRATSVSPPGQTIARRTEHDPEAGSDHLGAALSWQSEATIRPVARLQALDSDLRRWHAELVGRVAQNGDKSDGGGVVSGHGTLLVGRMSPLLLLNSSATVR
jgi:hypothetical protein